VGLAGWITEVAFQNSGSLPGSGEFGSVRMMLGLTSHTSLGEYFADNYDIAPPERCLYLPYVELKGEPNSWYHFRLDTPYYYDNDYNLILEVSWLSGERTTDTWCYWTAYISMAFSPSASSPKASGLYNWANRLMLIIEPNLGNEIESLGKMKALFL
jgi:hypothetical protein